MEKKVKFSLATILIVFIVILSNIPPTSYVFDYIFDEKHYSYVNSSESFNVTDRSGNNLTGIKKSFDEFIIRNNPKPSDRILYRTFWKNPFAFWRWHTYFNGDERYELPYKW